MDLREFLADNLKWVRQATMNMTKDLTPEQLRWQPGAEANHIGYLLFHTFRGEDRLFHTWVSKEGEIWEREGWAGRFQLPVPPAGAPDTWSAGAWPGRIAASWQPPALDLLHSYGEAVRKRTLDSLPRLDLARLNEHPRPDRPQLTVLTLLEIVPQHEAQHQGQIDYLLGLMKDAHA